MNYQYLRLRAAAFWLALVVLGCSASRANAQNCQTSDDMDESSRSAITSAGQRYFDLAAKGDTASLRQNAIASLASNFSGIGTTIKDHQQELSAAHAVVKSIFLLETQGTAPVPHAEFYCGVFGKNGQTPGSAVFYFDNLPIGKYAVDILDATSAKGRTNFSVILQQAGADWKLGGLYIQPAQVAGHDTDWFVARAREYKAKGQPHNAWLYYLAARSLISPLSFMSTLATDKLYDESHGLAPTDVPADGKTADLSTSTATYKLTALFPAVVGNDLDLIVKYQSADVANTTQAFESNVAVIKALVGKYPELRDAFAAVVARAVDPGGRDYGTLMAMKEIK